MVKMGKLRPKEGETLEDLVEVMEEYFRVRKRHNQSASCCCPCDYVAEREVGIRTGERGQGPTLEHMWWLPVV